MSDDRPLDVRTSIVRRSATRQATAAGRRRAAALAISSDGAAPAINLLAADRPDARAIARAPSKCPCSRGVNLGPPGRVPGRSSGKAARARARCCTCWARSTPPTHGEIHFEGQRIDNCVLHAATPPQPPVRHDLPVLSPAAGADDAGKRAGPADDRPGVWGFLARAAAPPRRRPELLRTGRPGTPAEAPAPRAFRRRDAAGRHRPGPGAGPNSSWPTSPPATSTRTPAARSSKSCAP